MLPYQNFKKLTVQQKKNRLQLAQPSIEYDKNIPGEGISYPEENWIELIVEQTRRYFFSFGQTRKIKLNTFRWKSKQQPKAIIVIIHGLNSHSNEGISVAKSFVENGYQVVAFDLRGFGKSQGEKALISQFDLLVKDSQKFINLVREQYKNKKIYVCGLSMGGLIAFQLSFLMKEEIEGYIFFAPAFKAYTNKIVSSILSGITFFFPSIKISKSSGANKGSKNPRIAEFREKDPYKNNDKPYAKTLKVLLDSMQNSSTKFHQFNKPFIVIQGGLDKSVDADGTIEFFEKSTSKVKQIEFYQNLWHYIWFQEQIVQIMAKVNTWVDSMLI